MLNERLGMKINGEIKKAHQAAKGIGGWAATIVALYALAAAVGFPLPTPAWSSDIDGVRDEIYSVRGDIADLRIEGLESALRAIDGEIYQINLEIGRIRDAGNEPPAFMINRVNQLMIEKQRKLIQHEELVREEK